jgi:hypothetical protein
MIDKRKYRSYRYSARFRNKAFKTVLFRTELGRAKYSLESL